MSDSEEEASFLLYSVSFCTACLVTDGKVDIVGSIVEYKEEDYLPDDADLDDQVYLTRRILNREEQIMKETIPLVAQPGID